MITLDDNFSGKFFYHPKTEFVERHKVSDSFLLDKIRDGDYLLVVLYDCFFAYNGKLMNEITEITQSKENLLLVNVLPLNSAVIKTGLFKGETAERIDFPDWEKEHLHICSSFQSKTNLYEKTQLFPDIHSPNDKPDSFTQRELYKKEFHFYQLLKTHLRYSTDMNVFSLFLNELSLETQQVNIPDNNPLIEAMTHWSKITYRFCSYLKNSNKSISEDYVEQIQGHVRKIIQTNMPVFDKIRDFFVEDISA